MGRGQRSQQGSCSLEKGEGECSRTKFAWMTDILLPIWDKNVDTSDSGINSGISGTIDLDFKEAT